MDTDISYINKYLHKFANDKHQELLRRHPESQVLLNAMGVSLGVTDTEVAVDAAKTMLESVDSITSSALSDILGKLKTNRRLELIGSILTLSTSGGVVGSIIGFDEKYVAAFLGAIGFLGSLVMLFAKWLKGSVTGSSSLDKEFDKLREYSWDARALKARLSHNASDKEIENVILESNRLAREIFLVLGGLGYEPNFEPV